MSLNVWTEQRPGGHGLDGTVYVLADSESGTRAEVWPALGFNCYRWQVTRDGHHHELLYAAPDLWDNPVPTRSGIPILFPFPNRIRDGRFTWDGKEYQLPLNDPSRKNAIHGFACSRPWRVLGSDVDAGGAWLRGEFRGSLDAPETMALWPADYCLHVTFRLKGSTLRIDLDVENQTRHPLPFGVGLHPYFRTEPFGGPDCLVEAPAHRYWELKDNLPTGKLLPVDEARDLNRLRRFEELNLDDVLADLPENPYPSQEPLRLRGRLRLARATMGLDLVTSPAFREMVVFTPPHRQAVCLEPYTCTTDAINLEQRQIEAGWLQLPPGQRWAATVLLEAK